MKVRELIDRLSKFDPDIEVSILDGNNGGGQPRTINLGPLVYDPKKWPRCTEGNDFSDIDTPQGEPIIQMGYGCY